MAARTKRGKSPNNVQAVVPSNQAAATIVAQRTKETNSVISTTTTTPLLSNADQLPPLLLQGVVIVCSGFWFVLSLRDFATTGKSMFGNYDDAYLKFTDSTQWFDDSKGWKSQQGGFSAVENVSTDMNNMGGFFMRKLVGCTGLGLQLYKILPIVLLCENPFDTHYHWVLISGILSNLSLVGFLASYRSDLKDAQAWHIPALMMTCAVLESFVFLYYVLLLRIPKKPHRRGPATAFQDGKTPDSLVSKIVARTVAIVSSCMLLYGVRGWLFSGMTIPLFPYDDLFLEWTNAYFHSPPVESPEYDEQGIAVGFYLGDKFICQLACLQLTILCLYKLFSSWTIRLGRDGRGEAIARMMWKPAVIADLFLLFQLRVFSSAAQSASCNLRYHLMILAYEAFIVGLYAFF